MTIIKNYNSKRLKTKLFSAALFILNSVIKRRVGDIEVLVIEAIGDEA